ncbi:unnamed protein product [Meloidogyne enterolobii]|uniref:Uncharacterized protein n=1 Tax=Meloidogyne enterolobii TaxID=390850 RepID=A0ACB0Y379_MELEN
MSNWPQSSSEFSSLNSSISRPYRDYTSNYTTNLQQNHYNNNLHSAFPSHRDSSLSFNYEEIMDVLLVLLFWRGELKIHLRTMPASLDRMKILLQVIFRSFTTPGVPAAIDTYYSRNINSNQNVRTESYEEPDPIASLLQQRHHKVQGIPSLKSLFVPESSTNSTINKNSSYSSREGLNLTPQMHLISTSSERDQRKGSRLKRLLGIPMAKELWLETATGRLSFDGGQIVNRLEENRTYYYNISTLRVSFEMPSPLSAIIRQQTEIRKMLDMASFFYFLANKCFFRQLLVQLLLLAAIIN